MRILVIPMDWSTPGFPVHHQLPELAQTHGHWVNDAIQASHPQSSPSPSAFNLSQHQVLFQWVSSSHEQNRNINNKRDKTKPWGNSRTKKYKMLNENFTRGIQMQIWASSRICKSENRTIEIIEFEEQKKKKLKKSEQSLRDLLLLLLLSHFSHVRLYVTP